MFGLGHIDIGPLIYGTVMFIGIWLMWLKLVHMKLISLLASISIFWLVFSLHGGTMAGGFSAMICALLFDFFMFPPWRKS
jgi:K+-sensing histidine kinase KdpD